MNFSTRDLTVRYEGSRRPALKEVSITVPDGSFYVVLGPNGSGKSTLMRALLGLVEPERGEAIVGGRPIRRWGRRELARRVGAVAQVENLSFPLTVRELVAMGRYPHLGALRAEREIDREAIRAALDRCDLSRFVDREIATLSGGELQRVRIARALAQEPRALVLDEPTASLDIRHEMTILQLLRSSADRGMTILLITHHLNVAARFADRLLLLNRGEVAAEGEVEEVLSEEVLERVYEWPIRVEVDEVSDLPRVTPLLPD